MKPITINIDEGQREREREMVCMPVYLTWSNIEKDGIQSKSKEGRRAKEDDR